MAISVQRARRERRKQVANKEGNALASSSPYTPGSLTSFLQSTAAVSAEEPAQENGKRKPARENTTTEKRQKRHKPGNQSTESADLKRLRAFFASASKPKEATSTDTNRISRNQVTRRAPPSTDGLDSTHAAEGGKPFRSERARVEKVAAPETSSKESRSLSAAGSVASPEAQSEVSEASERRPLKQDSEDKLQRTLFIGNLPMRLRSVPIAAQFHKCRRAAIARQQFSSACDQQNAYLVLKDKSLVTTLTKKELPPFRGRELRLDSATRRGFSLFDRKRSVCVGGLSKNATESDLKQALCCFGPVENSRVVRDKVTRSSKGFGFVCFADRGSAAKAVLAATCTILGRSVRLMRALTEEECRAKETEEQKAKKGKTKLSPAARRVLARKERKMQKRQINRATGRGEGARRHSRL